MDRTMGQNRAVDCASSSVRCGLIERSLRPHRAVDFWA